MDPLEERGGERTPFLFTHILVTTCLLEHTSVHSSSGAALGEASVWQGCGVTRLSAICSERLNQVGNSARPRGEAGYRTTSAETKCRISQIV